MSRRRLALVPLSNQTIGPIAALRQEFPAYLCLVDDRMLPDHRRNSADQSLSLPDSSTVIDSICRIIGGVPIALWGSFKRFGGVSSGPIGVIGRFEVPGPA